MRTTFRKGEKVRWSSLSCPWNGSVATVQKASKSTDMRVLVEYSSGHVIWTDAGCLMLESEYQECKDLPLSEWPRWKKMYSA